MLALLLLTATTVLDAQNAYRPSIDLSGTWQFSMVKDSNVSAAELPAVRYTDTVTLPGTTDTNGKGTPLQKFDETTHLSRKFAFEGMAYYRRDVDIPKVWRGRSVLLTLERTKATSVFVDDVYVGSNSNISTAQSYDLTAVLTPGRHTLTVAVDNRRNGRIPEQIFTSSHAATEDTQTNWNGIIGRISLVAQPKRFIDNVRLMAQPGHYDAPVCSFDIKGEGRLRGKGVRITLYDSRTGRAVHTEYSKFAGHQTLPCSLSYALRLQQPLKAWSDETPALYRVSVAIDGVDSTSVVAGLCDFRTAGSHFTANNNTVFLRGKHDACVFPLTAHTPMDSASWHRYFAVLKEYGINHVRFHSWCPPEECFNAADEMGVYLQPELPFWGDFNAADTLLMTFLRNEGRQIVQQYSHHPSFVMFALGNELWGSIDMMRSFVDEFRSINPSLLYTFGSNFYLGWKGVSDGMDYFTTCRNGGEAWGDYNTHTRGSFSFADAKDGGILNHFYPNSMRTLKGAIDGCPVPVISHETGQFQCFPDFSETALYTGVLKPCNIEVFRQRLDDAGMGSQAREFLEASGRWAVELYKADIELDLRTQNMAGFQLLDLQDYPGQGSAYVGILNAFMKNKGLVTAKRWREWCSEVVPLMQTERFCYTDGDTLRADLNIASYTSRSYGNGQLSWLLADEQGGTLAGGKNVLDDATTQGLIKAGNIAVPLKLADPERSQRLTLTLYIDGTPYRNSWRLWLYPKEDYAKKLKALCRGIVTTDTLSADIIGRLEAGAKVLLMPRKGAYKEQTVGGLFQTDYWNYRMFRTICENNKKEVSPGTLGLLVNAAHPLLRNFPTDTHTDWQWRDMAFEGTPFILDSAPKGYRPIVQVIDNTERNHRLGLVFEFCVGKGRLLVCMADMNHLTAHPESRRFHLSLLEYMQSADFQPTVTLTASELSNLFNKKPEERNVESLRNISFE